MGLETTATYVDSLNQLWPNPLLGDKLDEADDHLRLIKAAIQRTFPSVAGVVLASNTEMGHLIGVNQNPQVQFDNLREGTATANAAINALYANSASYAENAGSVSYAASAGNNGDQYYGGLLGGIATTSNSYTTLARVILPRTGLYRLRASMFNVHFAAGLLANQPVRSFRFRISGSASVVLAATFGSSIFSKASSSASDGALFAISQEYAAGAEASAQEFPNTTGIGSSFSGQIHAQAVADVVSLSRSVAVELQMKSGPTSSDVMVTYTSLLRAQRLAASNGGL